jgi:hypothetical protein
VIRFWRAKRHIEDHPVGLSERGSPNFDT